MILAIDIGSSSLRAAVFTAAGDLLPDTLARRPIAPTTTDDGGMTYNPAALFAHLTQVVSRTLRLAARYGGSLSGVGVSTMMHSLMGVRLTPDGTADVGGPTTPVFAWGDTRSETEREHWATSFAARRLYARTGCPLHSSYWLLKLSWLKRRLNLAEWRWMSFAEYAWLRLFGVAYTSVSLASATGLYSRRDADWDEEILADLGLTKHHLPPVADDDFALAGDQLRPPFRNRWSPLRQAKFFPPLADGACGNLGSLCFTDTRAAVNIGTTAALRITVPTDREPEAPPPGLWAYRLDRRRALIGGALSNAGNLLAWARRTLRLPPPAALEAATSAARPDDTGLTVLPFWAGERSLGWRSHAVGAIIGLRLATDAVALWRALLETLAVRLAWIADELEAAGLLPATTPCVASGGVLASVAFATILCHALGRPLCVIPTETSARGAALWVSLRLGLITADRCRPPDGQWFQPDAAAHARYRACLRRHRAAADTLFGGSTAHP
ncbi:MAG: FGGY family carbohydrate kinase [Chloracidobacterium sp.]|nr:FGGY family carbohydrate kinase [Chloracidobacterium sp.]MDW8216979.1 FGGY family carbohydrate kinase [Acidobacteriota bacterium]